MIAMSTYSLVKVIHIITAILMAWPFYALVVVNTRARLGPPLGDRVDMYMETIIRNRAVPCFIFQATALVSGLTMVFLSGEGLGGLILYPALGFKVALLLWISSLLSYVHFRLQPQIDALFDEYSSASAQEVAARIGRLRLQRKRVASLCLFIVLTISMLGVQAWRPFPWWLTVVLLFAMGVFVWRAYRGVPRFGWV
jgi:hypothetical protein